MITMPTTKPELAWLFATAYLQTLTQRSACRFVQRIIGGIQQHTYVQQNAQTMLQLLFTITMKPALAFQTAVNIYIWILIPTHANHLVMKAIMLTEQAKCVYKLVPVFHLYSAIMTLTLVLRSAIMIFWSINMCLRESVCQCALTTGTGII